MRGKAHACDGLGGHHEICFKEDLLLSLEHHLARLPCLKSLIDILQKCRKNQNGASATFVLLHTCNYGLEALEVIGNHLVPMLVDCDCIKEAQQVFNRQVYCNEYSWTSLIQGYSACGKAHHALNMYRKMQEDKVHPSTHTYVILLAVCAKLKVAERGEELHNDITKDGFETNYCIGGALVDMYAKCSLLSEAQHVFNELPVRDVITWTALIAGYCQHGHGEKAMYCFERMKDEGVSSDATALHCILQACGRIGAIDKGKEIHVEIVR
eukprot:c23698_g9_i2 orf=915-1718(+)